MRSSANSVWENNERPAGEFAGGIVLCGRRFGWENVPCRGRSCVGECPAWEWSAGERVPRGRRFGRQKNWQLVDINQKEMR